MRFLPFVRGRPLAEFVRDEAVFKLRHHIDMIMNVLPVHTGRRSRLGPKAWRLCPEVYP